MSLEILAAHVQPNHPALELLVAEASDELARMTGSGALVGYQQGPERVDATVDALMSAMRGRAVRYSVPPASWSDNGQKVRTPQEVLVGRLGTCLDTTVTLAAALERVGIRPMLVVVQSHAFLGYWREETSLPSPATGFRTVTVRLGSRGSIVGSLVMSSTVARHTSIHGYIHAPTNQIRKVGGPGSELLLDDTLEVDRRCRTPPIG